MCLAHRQHRSEIEISFIIIAVLSAGKRSLPAAVNLRSARRLAPVIHLTTTRIIHQHLY